jgi:molecular chaperone DnaJ
VVPTVTSSTTLKIPGGTQSGQVIHVRGRGMHRVNASGTGDLNVSVQLWTPDRLSDDEQELIARLGEIQKSVPLDSRNKGFWAKMKEALGA